MMLCLPVSASYRDDQGIEVVETGNGVQEAPSLGSVGLGLNLKSGTFYWEGLRQVT